MKAIESNKDKPCTHLQTLARYCSYDKRIRANFEQEFDNAFTLLTRMPKGAGNLSIPAVRYRFGNHSIRLQIVVAAKHGSAVYHPFFYTCPGNHFAKG